MVVCCHYDEGYEEGYRQGAEDSSNKALDEAYNILLEVEKCHLLDNSFLGDRLGSRIDIFLSENQNAAHHY